jgi:hypothetical protein
MKQYLLSIYQPTGATPPPEALDKVMHDVHALVEEAKDADAWVFDAACILRARPPSCGCGTARC